MQNQIRKLLSDHSQIPVVNFTTLSNVDMVCDRLLGVGISCIEITLRSPIALESIELAKKNYGHKMAVGVGTVINSKPLEKLKRIGVDFLVSPGATNELIDAMERTGLPYLPGVMTPSEIICGLQKGLDTFKLFPANIAGGLKALKAYNAVFSQAKFCPTGGISKDNFQEYLDLPNVISVGGSWLAK